MDGMVKIGVIALGGLAVVGAIVTVFKSSSSSPPTYPESQSDPTQESDNAPPQESYDLPGGMERESEDSENPERGSVGGRKSKRKRKSRRKKRSKRA